MGKTKIQVLTEEPKVEKSSLNKYKERQERKKREALKKEVEVRVPGLKGGERVVVVTGEIPEEQAKETAPASPKEKIKAAKQHIRGKRYKAARLKIEPGKSYLLDEAVKLAQDISISRFDGNIELHCVTAKQKLEAEVALPHSSGQSKKIEIADEVTLKKLKDERIDFDVLVATPDMMQKLVPYAKVLGPKGLMPNPKNGTLTDNPKKAVEKFAGNALRVKTEKKAPLVHTVIGKVSQPTVELEENLKAVIDALGAKNIQRAYVCATMGPAVRLAVGA